jgi:hypothetical protein
VNLPIKAVLNVAKLNVPLSDAERSYQYERDVTTLAFCGASHNTHGRLEIVAGGSEWMIITRYCRTIR